MTSAPRSPTGSKPPLRESRSAPNVRSAAFNFAWLAADKLVRFVLNTIVGFWVARHLGPEQFGTLIFAIAMVGLAQPLAELGLEAVLRREFIRTPDKAAILAATAKALRLAGGTLAAALLGLSWLTGWGDPVERALSAVLVFSLWSPAFLIGESWLHARLAARAIVISQWLALALAAAARITLIALDAPLMGYAIVLVAEMFAASLLIGWSARRAGLYYGAVDWTLARTLLRESWPLLLSGVAVLLYMRTDALMLRLLANENAVGLYAAATRLTEIWYFVPTALAASLLPALLRAEATGAPRWQAFYDLNVALAYLVATATTLVATPLTRLAYGEAYEAATSVLALYAWSLPFVFLGVARTQALVSSGHTRFYLCATAAGLVLNVALNFLLIPLYGAAGAAFATVLAQAVAAWFSSFCFPPLRSTAWMQTRALLIPVRWFHYVRSER